MFRTILTSLRRMAHLMRVLTLHLLAHLGGRRLARLPLATRIFPAPGLSGPDRLRIALEDMGGTFIKLGQMLALQPDVLSFAYCNALFDLMDRVAPFEFGKVERLFLDETGRRPHEIFDTFEQTPIATASIGQVHMATLKGQRVVVKVQRPNVDRDFMGDIRLMKAMLRVIRKLRITPLYWLIEPVSEFVNWTQEELDYRHEARYMDRLRRNAVENAKERIPMVYWPHSTRRLLTLEYFEGITALNYLRSIEGGNRQYDQLLGEMRFDPNQFARHIIENFLGDAFRYGIFHADLHPANLIIQYDNTVGYVDFGITGVLSHYSRKELVALTLAYTRADLDGMCTAFFKVSSMDADSDIAGFRKGLQEFADDWYEARGDHRKLRKNFTFVMLDMLHLSKKTGIWPERDVIKYIRSSIAIDGLITRFAPGFDVGEYLAATCARYLREASFPGLTPAVLADWSYASSRLIRDGGVQVMGLLHKLSRSGGAMSPEKHPEGTDRRIVRLGGVLLVVSILTVATTETPTWGINLFTVETALLSLTGLLLLQALYRR
ncbi:MAG: AarF/ABC1/UbiB kinase family protein [candidate division Zixibacteria bacterium]|nr:AarF/ABC1/UbiB kinase family protein [candidate division Zixibacteria bacterium]